DVLYELDPVLVAVRDRQLAGELDHVAWFESDNAPRAQLAGEQRERPRAGSDIEHDRMRSDHLPEGCGICAGAGAIADHRAVIRDAVAVGRDERGGRHLEDQSCARTRLSRSRAGNARSSARVTTLRVSGTCEGQLISPTRSVRFGS